MAPDRCVVDSSVFIALYHEGDVHHADALNLLSEAQELTMVVHPYVLQEVTSILVYRFGLEAARRFLNDVLLSPDVNIPPIDARRDGMRFLEIGKRMSLTDIALVELARVSGYRLLTFDKQMQVLASKMSAGTA